MHDDNPYQAPSEKILDQRDSQRKAGTTLLICLAASMVIQLLGALVGVLAYNPKSPSMTNIIVEILSEPTLMTRRRLTFLPYSFFKQALIAMPIAWIWVGFVFWGVFFLGKWALKHLKFYFALIREEIGS